MERAGIKVDKSILSRLTSTFAQRIAPAGGGDLRAGRPQVQSGLAQAARRVPVRQPEAAGRPQDQDRPMGDARQPARRSGRPARTCPSSARKLINVMLEWRQLTKLQVDLHGLAAAAHQSRDRPHPHLLRAGLHHHRAAGLDRPQPAEHPDPHQGGARDPHGLHRRARAQADLRRLQPDRAARAGPHRRHPAAAPRPSPRASTFTP